MRAVHNKFHILEFVGLPIQTKNNSLPRTSTFIPNCETFQSPDSFHFSRSDTLNASSSFEDEPQIPQDVNPPEQQQQQQMIEVPQNMLKRFFDASAPNSVKVIETLT